MLLEPKSFLYKNRVNFEQAFKDNFDKLATTQVLNTQFLHKEFKETPSKKPWVERALNEKLLNAPVFFEVFECKQTLTRITRKLKSRSLIR